MTVLSRLGISRYELRWVRRHPVRYLRIMWFQFSVAALLAVMAFVIGEPVFAVTTAARIWPLLLAFAAGLAAASALAPLEWRLQAFVAATLFSIFVLRVATFVDTYLRAGDAVSDEGLAVVAAFAIHWAVLALVAAWWPTISERAGQELVVEAGADERAGGR